MSATSTSESFNQSQTPAEQAELVKYEANLAACYEAEYLLSLKLQEEFYGSNSDGGDGLIAQFSNNDFYCDSYEVVWMPGIEPAHIPANCSKANCGDFSSTAVNTLKKCNKRDAEACSRSGDNTTLPIMISEKKSQVNGTAGLEDMDCTSAEYSSLKQPNFWTNGSGSDNYMEGPSRKRMRLQQD